MKHVTARAILSAGIGLLITMVCMEYTWGFLFSVAGFALGYWQYKASQKKHSPGTLWKEYVFPDNEEEVALLLKNKFGWDWEMMRQAGAGERMIQDVRHRYINDERNDFLASQRKIKEEMEKWQREKEIEYKQREKEIEYKQREKVRQLKGSYSDSIYYNRNDVVSIDFEGGRSVNYRALLSGQKGFYPPNNLDIWQVQSKYGTSNIKKDKSHGLMCYCPTCLQKTRSILADIDEERDMLFIQNGGRGETRAMTVRQTCEMLHGKNCLCIHCGMLAQDEVAHEIERRVYKCIDKHFPLSSEEIADEIRREKIKEM